MEFRLVYEGPLKANATPKEKHPIRKALHPQLKDLWQHPPLTDYRSYLAPKGTLGGRFPELVTNVGAFSFASLVHSDIQLLAEIEVVILKPDGPGSVISQGGDLDNQLKTLLDALRQPHDVGELDAQPGHEVRPPF